MSLFKGLALFTPGGDLIYCLAPDKQEFWHIHLSMKLQLLLGLAEVPHFLIPGYTATVDRYFDHQSNTINTLAEVYPAVSCYQPLLNVIFNLGDFSWQTVPWQEKLSNPIIFESYRYQFPQLWEHHNLVVRYELKNKQSQGDLLRKNPERQTNSSLFYLFISEDYPDNNQVLSNLYHWLEKSLKNCYSLKIIEIKENPELAETYHISAIPTLIRVSPAPLKRLSGNLDNLTTILPIINN